MQCPANICIHKYICIYESYFKLMYKRTVTLTDDNMKDRTKSVPVHPKDGPAYDKKKEKSTS